MSQASTVSTDAPQANRNYRWDTTGSAVCASQKRALKIFRGTKHAAARNAKIVEIAKNFAIIAPLGSRCTSSPANNVAGSPLLLSHRTIEISEANSRSPAEGRERARAPPQSLHRRARKNPPKHPRKKSPAAAMLQVILGKPIRMRWSGRLLALGARVHVDFHADGDFNDLWCLPSHVFPRGLGENSPGTVLDTQTKIERLSS